MNQPNYQEVNPYYLFNNMNVRICAGVNGCGALVWKSYLEEHTAFHEVLRLRED